MQSKQEHLSKLAVQIVEQKRIIAEAEKAKKQLQEQLAEICDAQFSDLFDSDGEHVLKDVNIVIKTALNPPKMIFTKTDKALTPADRSDVAMNLDKQYIVLDLDFKKIQNRLESDKQLKKALSTAGVKIEQDIRYDVKPLK